MFPYFPFKREILFKQYQSPLLFIFLLVLFSGLVGFFLIQDIQKTTENIENIYLTQPRLPAAYLKLNQGTLFFVGDIMLNRGIKSVVETYGGGNFEFPFFKIADYLKTADILFGNLEGPISDKGKNVGSIYSFRAIPEVLKGLKFAGFDILSVANNHIFDYGREAMEDTLIRLKEAQIEYIGAGFSGKEALSPKIIEKKGTKIVFLAFTNLGEKSWEAKENSSGIAWLNKENLEHSIKKAKKEADIVIVSMHYGQEYQLQPTKEQKDFSRLAIDLGADLVIGHHSHVVQPIEQYKQGYIAYSLGNFVFDQNFSKETMEGLLLEVLIKSGKIEKITPRDIKINNFFQPELIN